MRTELRSGFRVAGIGVVVEHLKPTSLYAKIHLLEHMGSHTVTFEDKETNTKSATKHNFSNPLGGIVTPDVKFDTVIEARWLHSNGNRISPPTLYRGETVKVYQYADSDQYFWEPMYYEPDIRGKEVGVFAYSNLEKRKKGEREKNFLKMMDKDSSYWYKIDTINKKVHLHTSNNDKEPATWDIGIDTKKGIFRLENSKNNYFEMSLDHIFMKTTHFKVIANDGTWLLKKKGLFNTPDLTIKGGVLNILSKTIHKAMTIFKAVTNFKASVKINKNTKTTDGSSVL